MRRGAQVLKQVWAVLLRAVPEGSDLIKKLLLDHDPRPVYPQVWGGPNTIARALKSIQDQYSGTPQWSKTHERVSKKAVILASGLQDHTYADYIAPNWPDLRTEDLSAGYATWGYNCNWSGKGNTRGLPGDEKYFEGAWTKQNIQIGPLGSLYRSWLDGQAMPGDPADIFGDPELAKNGWCPPLSAYDFLSEGDNVAYLPLLDTGIQVPGDPNLGSLGGRAVRTSTSSNLWTMVPTETDATGSQAFPTTPRTAGRQPRRTTSPRACSGRSAPATDRRTTHRTSAFCRPARCRPCPGRCSSSAACPRTRTVTA